MRQPYLEDVDLRLYQGDALEVLREMPSGSVHMACTSPPFWSLRDYQTEGQIGLEETIDEWVERLCDVFDEVKRVLRDDGTFWCELGDSYSSGNRQGHGTRIGVKQGTNRASAAGHDNNRPPTPEGLKPKDLIGQPWRLAFALQQRGWFLRSEIIWARRPTQSDAGVRDRQAD